MENLEADAGYMSRAENIIANENLVGLTRIATEIKSLGKSRSKHATDTEKQNGSATIADLMSNDPSLDTNNAAFDVYKWTKTVLAIATQRGVKFRQASFSFKNLTVEGSAPRAKMKENVVSVLFPYSIFTWMTNRSSNKRKILKDCIGFVNSGEMMMILGRTGSGCSTFLKTVAGEMRGLEFNANSTLEYNGNVQCAKIL